MANVVVTLRVMPQSTETDLDRLESKATQAIIDFCGSKEFRTSIQPIAFGLKALSIIFVMDESIGTTEALEKRISEIEGVESVEVTDVRRAIG